MTRFPVIHVVAALLALGVVTPAAQKAGQKEPQKEAAKEGSRDDEKAANAIYARLETPVSTTKSAAGDKVSAISITALMVDGRMLATPGCKMPGVVKESTRPKGLNGREIVALEFAELIDRAGASHAIGTKIIEVDNARETIDEQGRIQGVAPVDKKPDDPGDVLKIAANGTQIMRAMMSKLIGRVPPQIDYKPGVELILSVEQLPKGPPITCGPVAAALPQSDELTRIVNALTFRSFQRDGKSPSDITNLVFVGSYETLATGFAAAGWVTAESMNATSSAKTFLATVAGEGYKEAPVSAQFIDGRPPDAVFQKAVNTFAKRHHVRIWQTDVHFRGQQVWIAAATHDVGFVVSKEVKLFNHGIHPNIDLERLKIVNDLAFAGAVAGHNLVARPKAPREGKTSSGEEIRTDGKAAVILLQHVKK